jgi:hypothetical protein
MENKMLQKNWNPWSTIIGMAVVITAIAMLHQQLA